jgi:hypothetical protein
LTPAELAAPAIRTIGGAEYRLYSATCPDSGTTLRYVRVGVTSRDLIDGVTDLARTQLQPPVPDINPSAQSGGIVNLGMWLAVQPQTMPPITAAAGPAWITLAPLLESTTFDFGNGDAITCDGTGTPIAESHPALDVSEQSPTCGYTYRRSSPNTRPYRLTITTSWALPYTSSDGPGQLPPIDRSVTVDYDVDEIQTVGVNG